MVSFSKVESALKQTEHRSLLAALCFMIVVSPFLPENGALSWIFAVMLMVILLTAARTISGRGHSFRIALIFGIPALLSQAGVLGTDFHWVGTVRYAATALFLFWTCGLLFYNIALRAHSVTLELILGAVNVYLLLGLGFAFVYGLIEHLQPGSFTGLEDMARGADLVLIFVYFSFISISTLGYGDVSPLTEYGMTTAYVEAIAGQLYLAILMARLVALYIGRRREPGH